MSLWSRLMNRLRGQRKAKERTFELDEGVLRSLHALAEREQRPPDEVARSLLARALEERQAADECQARWKTLTPREQQVVALICLNYTTPQIAARLEIASETAKTHAHNAFSKMGVRNRQDLRQKMSDWDFSGWDDVL